MEVEVDCFGFNEQKVHDLSFVDEIKKNGLSKLVFSLSVRKRTYKTGFTFTLINIRYL